MSKIWAVTKFVRCKLFNYSWPAFGRPRPKVTIIARAYSCLRFYQSCNQICPKYHKSKVVSDFVRVAIKYVHNSARVKLPQTLPEVQSYLSVVAQAYSCLKLCQSCNQICPKYHKSKFASNFVGVAIKFVRNTTRVNLPQI